MLQTHCCNPGDIQVMARAEFADEQGIDIQKRARSMYGVAEHDQSEDHRMSAPPVGPEKIHGEHECDDDGHRLSYCDA